MMPKKINQRDAHELMLYLGKLYRSSYLKNMRYAVYEIHEDPSCYINLEVSYEFDQILALLTPMQQEIIRNDYFLPKEENWWENKFCKSTYLKEKGSAITTFLDCLYT